MTLRIFDNLTRKKRVFSKKDGLVKILLCGPTVYDYSHMGHARTFVAFDTIVRYLRHRSHKTKVVMNVTDTSEDIFRCARRRSQSCRDYSDQYLHYFLEDMKALGIDTVDIVARASDNIPEIVRWVERLLKKGVAYVTDEGVFLDTGKVKGYGTLSHQSKSEIALRRLDLSPRKRHPQDFPVWRTLQVEGETWDSPWGRGRPGEHIEDTAACAKYLGMSYDINGGGDELVFPHHEATRAQLESVTDSPACRYWLHTGLLYVRGRKMSKSLGNSTTIRDALRRYDTPTIRLYLALTQYRKPIHFKQSDLRRAAKLSRQIRNGLEDLDKAMEKHHGKETATSLDAIISQFEDQFTAAMDDDFDSPLAVRRIVDFIERLRSLQSHGNCRQELSTAIESLTKLSHILGIL